MPNNFQDAIDILEAEVEPTQVVNANPVSANTITSKAPTDRIRMHAIAAREFFAGRTDNEVATTLDKSVKTIRRLRKDDKFMEYYSAYAERITKNVDKAIQAKLMAVLPARFDRMIELSKQSRSLQVAFQSTKWICELGGTSVTKEKLIAGAIEAPKEIRDALQSRGQTALSLPEKIKNAKRHIAGGESNVVQAGSTGNEDIPQASPRTGSQSAEESS